MKKTERKKNRNRLPKANKRKRNSINCKSGSERVGDLETGGSSIAYVDPRSSVVLLGN